LRMIWSPKIRTAPSRTSPSSSWPGSRRAWRAFCTETPSEPPSNPVTWPLLIDTNSAATSASNAPTVSSLPLPYQAALSSGSFAPLVTHAWLHAKFRLATYVTDDFVSPIAREYVVHKVQTNPGAAHDEVPPLETAEEMSDATAAQNPSPGSAATQLRLAALRRSTAPHPPPPADQQPPEDPTARSLIPDFGTAGAPTVRRNEDVADSGTARVPTVRWNEDVAPLAGPFAAPDDYFASPDALPPSLLFSAPNPDRPPSWAILIRLPPAYTRSHAHVCGPRLFRHPPHRGPDSAAVSGAALP